MTSMFFLNLWRGVVLGQMAFVIILMFHALWRTIPFLRRNPIHSFIIGRVLMLVAIILFVIGDATSIIHRFGQHLNYRTPLAQVALILVFLAWARTYKADLTTLEQVVRDERHRPGHHA